MHWKYTPEPARVKRHENILDSQGISGLNYLPSDRQIQAHPFTRDVMGEFCHCRGLVFRG
jgi:hypothetical protein